MVHIVKTKDAESLARLNKEVQEWHASMYPDIFKPYDVQAIQNAFEDLLSSADSHAFLAQRESQNIGYLLAFTRHKDENPFQYAQRILHIDQVSVIQAYRKKGVAHLLMNRAFQLAREQDIARIELDHWSLNDSARAFFQKMGFSRYNERMYKII